MSISVWNLCAFVKILKTFYNDIYYDLKMHSIGWAWNQLGKTQTNWSILAQTDQMLFSFPRCLEFIWSPAPYFGLNIINHIQV